MRRTRLPGRPPRCRHRGTLSEPPTAAEISSVNSVDDRAIPCPGPMTKAIADVYSRAVRGEEGKYKEWCELV